MSRSDGTRSQRERGATSARYVTLVLVIAAASLALVLASPLALGLFGGAHTEWERLSFIGQTYGAVSALIAVLALAGVVLTLIYQARETRRAIEETRRQGMTELLRMAMDDVDLDACWGPVPPDADRRERKQRLYTNMIIGQWASAYDTGALPEERLRVVAAEMFQGEAGHTFWTEARKAASMTEGTRRERRFVQILDEVYRETVPPHLAADSATARVSPARNRWPATLLTVGATVTALASGVLVWWRHRNRPRPTR